jgi:predicted outer membrane repeat protein
MGLHPTPSAINDKERFVFHNLSRSVRWALVVLVLLALSVPAALATPTATVFTVTNTNDSGPGSLRQAITQANQTSGPDTIRVTAHGTVHLASTLVVTDDLTLLGPGADLFAVDGGGSLQVFRIQDERNVAGNIVILPVNAGLADLAVQNGHAAHGGGIQSTGALTLTNVNFLDNLASVIGGGADVGGPLTLIGGRFVNNTAQSNGGGLYAHNTLHLTGTQFIGNNGADAGGGILAIEEAHIRGGRFENNYCTGSHCIGGGLAVLDTAIVTDTQFISNTAIVAGGGMFFEGGTVRITNSGFAGNTAGQDGGGVHIELGGTLATLTDTRQDIIDTQFIGNRAQRGGGLFINTYIDDDHIGAGVVENGLFARNRATSGAAIALGDAGHGGDYSVLHTTIDSGEPVTDTAIVVDGGQAIVQNSILANYTTGIQHLAGTVDERANLFFHTDVLTTSGVTSHGGSIIGDPLFANPTQDDYHLSAGSPAIDQAIASIPPVDKDFEGDVRPSGPKADLGFDEYVAGAPTRSVYLPLVRR